MKKSILIQKTLNNMAIFEKGKQFFRPVPSAPKTGSTPPKFNPPDWTTPVYRPPRRQKPLLSKPAPEKPKTLFQQKKDWQRTDFLRKATKEPFTSKGKMYSSGERKKLLEEALPLRRFSTYISEGEVKTRLRELRREEYRAKSGQEKTKLRDLRGYLEKQSGLKGKY
jgi:hypothetical protein